MSGWNCTNLISVFFDLIKASENVAELLFSTKYDSQLLPFVMLIVELH